MPLLPEPEKPTRQRDADRTRAAILSAAQSLFATRGFANTGVREIAELAGVNSALVGRYFGSKEQLFRATLDRVLDMTPVQHAERRSFGADMVAAFFEAENIASPLAMMILATADPATREASIELLQAKVVAPLASWLGSPDGEERAARLIILWGGFLTYWKLLPLQPLAEARIASTRRWLEAATQAIVDEGAP
jgi:AcrR family transcriptional regulator